MLSSSCRDVAPPWLCWRINGTGEASEWEVLGGLGRTGLLLLLSRWNLGFERSFNGGNEVFVGQSVSALCLG